MCTIGLDIRPLIRERNSTYFISSLSIILLILTGYTGIPRTRPQDLQRMECPLLALYGGLDGVIKSYISFTTDLHPSDQAAGQ
jgi:hypothetical protein